MEERSNRITATINGEDWEFFDASVNRAGDELEINGQGYIGGDETTEPMNLQITIVGVPEQGEINAPFEASFAPNTEGVAATATIIPVNQPLVFDTELDANADGRIEISEVEGNTISGDFNFIATDQGGRSLEVTNGRFNNLAY